jgi:predicted small metal-binding protein
MTKTFACKDMGAANCNYTDQAKDENSLVRKVKDHVQKVHKEIKNFDAGVEAKVRAAIKSA